MGFWNDGVRPARSRSRSSSPSHTSRRKSTTSSNRHYSSRPSFARSASSFLGLGSDMGGSRPRGSYTSARPRSGFIARVRRFLRQVWEYMRKNPVKVFMLVIMPLITGGVLTKLLATVGIRLPGNIESMMGGMARQGGEGGRFYARGGARDFAGGSALPGMGGGMGEAVQGALSIAKMFM